MFSRGIGDGAREVAVAVLQQPQLGALGVHPENSVDVGGAGAADRLEGEADHPHVGAVGRLQPEAVRIEEGVREKHRGVGGMEDEGVALHLEVAARGELGRGQAGEDGVCPGGGGLWSGGIGQEKSCMGGLGSLD